MNAKSTQHDAFFELWDVLLRYKWRFTLTSFVVMLSVLVLSLMLPRKYEAVAIFDRRTDMVLAEIMMRGAPSSFQDPRQSLMNELSGQPAIDQLIESVGPDLQAIAQKRGDELDLRALRAELGRRILVDFDIATPNFDRVRVRYTSNDPDMSRVIVNGLVRNYIQLTRGQIDERLKTAQAFFNDQAGDAKHIIEAQATKKLNFEIEHGNLLPDGPNSVETVRAMTEMALDQARERREAADMKVQALAEQLAKTPKHQPSVITSRNPELDRLEAKRRELEEKLSLYTAVYKMTDAHPDLIALKEEVQAIARQIAATEGEVVSQRQYATNPMYAELEIRLSSARSDMEAVQRQVINLEERLAATGASSAEMFPVRAAYDRLTRDMDQAERQLEFWEDNRRRVEMALKAEADNRGIRLDFVKPCDFIHKPVSPNLAQVLLATVGMGLFCGGLCVFFAHRQDTSFHDADDLNETLNLPVFGSVSEIINAQQRRVRHLKNYVLYPIHAAAMAAALIVVTVVLYLDLESPHYFEETPAVEEPAAQLSAATMDPSAGPFEQGMR